MPKTYRLFISHSWTYGDAYDRMIQFFEEQGLDYYNHSVPQNDPIHTNGTDKQLEAAIEAKIKGTSCIVILAGVYSSYSRWILKEIEIANRYSKPIIAVEPWGAERTSTVVKQNAHRTVKWQGKSIVDAIKELA
jgi:hypothetical protein